MWLILKSCVINLVKPRVRIVNNHGSQRENSSISIDVWNQSSNLTHVARPVTVCVTRYHLIWEEKAQPLCVFTQDTHSWTPKHHGSCISTRSLSSLGFVLPIGKVAEQNFKVLFWLHSISILSLIMAQSLQRYIKTGTPEQQGCQQQMMTFSQQPFWRDVLVNHRCSQLQ